jgi:O-antigen/teichoic acid export membrane protein
LKGYLARRQPLEGKAAGSVFLWFFLVVALAAMTLLVIGQRVWLPLFVDRPSLEGLELFALYQVLIIPVWAAPFLGLLKGQNPLLLSVYVLVGPSFACWIGLLSIPAVSGILIGLLSYALVGFVWILTQTTFVRQLRLKELFLDIWPTSWPLILYAVSAGLARSFDAWLVARHFDESAFAIFRYGAREFPLVMAFAAGLSTLMIPKLKKDEALEELKVRSTRLMHICYPVVAVMMLLSPLLFSFFFGAPYKESAMIFNIYLLLTLTQLTFPQSIVTARGDTKLLWYISLMELAVNVVASLILFRYFGLAGIVWGTLIAFGFEKIVLIRFVNKRYGILTRSMIDLAVWIRYAVLLSLVFMTAIWIFGM